MKSWFMLSLALAAFVFTSFPARAEQSVIYKSVGADVVLTPPSKQSSITHILWKRNGHLAVEWEIENVSYVKEFAFFTDHTILDHSNGELTLKNLTKEFSGVYTVEINGETGTGNINLTVLSQVPKPQISVSCNAEKTRCTLTCSGDVTGMDPKPTYKWKFNNTEKSQSNEHFEITPETSAPEFICELHNRVSFMSSDPISNPFISSPDGVKINTGIVVFVCLLACVLVTVVVHRVKSGMWFFQKDSMPWQPDFWQKPGCQAAPEPRHANGDQPAERNAMLESS
ncbi:hypothetical protein NQD34_001062 [Periophthalmus magnuspinnatus]|nr:hypothetical protein NQD34_001062 [Periophthalmus magnuspinnatus]